MEKIRPPEYADYGLLLLLGAILGSSFVLMKIAVTTVPTLQVVFFRLLVAFSVLYGWMKIKNLSYPSFQDSVFWKTVVLLGLTANVIPFILITWAEKEINSNLAAVYMATVPIFSVVLAHWMTTDEKISPKKIIGVGVSFLGVIILLWDALDNLSLGLLGQLACMLAAILYAFSSIVTKRIAHINATVISTAVLLSGLLFMLPIVLLVILFPDYVIEAAPISPSLNSILSIILLGLFPTALAFVIIYKLIHDVGAVFMTSATYLVPLFAVFWGFVILFEVIDASMVASILLITIGVYFVTKK